MFSSWERNEVSIYRLRYGDGTVRNTCIPFDQKCKLSFSRVHMHEFAVPRYCDTVPCFQHFNEKVESDEKQHDG